MHTNGFILTTRCLNKSNSLIKSISSQKLHSKSIQCLHFGFNSIPTITNKRLLYSTKHINTVNKWYTTTQLKIDMTEQEICEVISQMSNEQRTILTKTLALLEAQKVKGQLEGQLAATRWRSRFGRPAKVLPVLGTVDPSGSYCAVPEDWLQKKFVETTPPPTTKDLMQLGISNALPFIGFGFLDNFIMIIAGDYVEHTLGLFMCISTMAAAALGNTISDIIGIGSAYYIERTAESVGVKPPKLTAIQLGMKQSRRCANWGRVLGITIGCILGMCPLLFKKGPESDKKEQKEGETKP